MVKANMLLENLVKVLQFLVIIKHCTADLQYSDARILFFTAYITAQHCFKSLFSVTDLAYGAVKCLFVVILHHPDLSLNSTAFIINIFVSLDLSRARAPHHYFLQQVWHSLGSCCGPFHCDKF
jgi:hypothetical protein